MSLSDSARFRRLDDQVGQGLVDAGRLTPSQLDHCKKIQQARGGPAKVRLTSILTEFGFLTEGLPPTSVAPATTPRPDITPRPDPTRRRAPAATRPPAPPPAPAPSQRAPSGRLRVDPMAITMPEHPSWAGLDPETGEPHETSVVDVAADVQAAETMPTMPVVADISGAVTVPEMRAATVPEEAEDTEDALYPDDGRSSASAPPGATPAQATPLPPGPPQTPLPPAPPHATPRPPGPPGATPAPLASPDPSSSRSRSRRPTRSVVPVGPGSGSHAPRGSSSDETVTGAPLPAEVRAAAENPENLFGRFILTAELGRGGMGVVHAAFDPTLGRKVAIKMVLDVERAGPRGIERFRSEARSSAKLRHPNIVSVHEIGEENGRPFIVMDFVDGETLDAVLRRGDLGPRELAGLVRETALALHHAHEQGVVHRDVKPQNVMVDGERRALLTDFGLARDLNVEKQLSLEGQVIGTPYYVSPEQARGDREGTGPRSDVYSLGAVLYSSLVGRPPFNGTTLMDVLRQVFEDDPEPPREINPGVHPDLETIALKCMEKEPDLRYASAKAVADELGRFIDGKAIEARPLNRRERLGRWARRNRVLAATVVTAVLIVTALLLTGIALGIISIQKIRQERDVATREREAAVAARAETVTERDRAQEAERLAVAAAGAEREAREEAETARGQAEQEREKASEAARAAQAAAEREAAARSKAEQERERARAAEEVARAAAAAEEAERARATVLARSRGELLAAALVEKGERLISLGRHAEAAAVLARSLAIVDGAPARSALARALPRAVPLRWVTSRLDATALAVDPERARLAIGDADGVVHVLEIASGREVAVMDAGTRGVAAVAWSPDGDWIVASGVAGAVTVIDVASGGRAAALDGHRRAVRALAWGARLATGSDDGTVRVWDVSNAVPSLAREPARVAPLAVHDLEAGAVGAVAWSPDGRLVAGGADGRLLAIASPERGAEAVITSQGRHGGAIVAVEVAADGRLVSLGADRVVKVRDLVGGARGQTIRIGGEVAPADVAWSPDGRRVAIGAVDGAVQVVEIGGTGEVTPTAVGEPAEGGVAALLWVDVARLAIVGRDRSFHLRDLGSGAVSARIEGHAGGVIGLLADVDADERPIASFGLDGTIRLWDRATGKARGVLRGHEGGVGNAVFLPGGERLASVGWDGSLRLWDLATGASVAVGRADGDPVRIDALDVSSAGIVTGDRAGRVLLWNAEDATVVAELARHDGRVRVVRFAYGSTRLASAGEDGRVHLLDAASPDASPVTLAAHDGEVRTVQWSPDGEWLATGGADGVARLFAADGTSGPRLEGHDDEVTALRFDPSGVTLASASLDRTVLLWDITFGSSPETTTASGRGVLRGHEDGLVALSFDADGSWLASADQGGSVRLWNPETADPVAVLRGHRGAALVGNFLDEGRTLLSAGFLDGTVRAWDLTFLRRGIQPGREVLGRHEASVGALLPLPDGAVASIGDDGVLRVHAPGGEAPDAWARGEGGPRVRALVYVDGTGLGLAASTEDGAVRVWPAGGDEAEALAGHGPAEVTAAAWSADGRALATAADDQIVKLWAPGAATDPLAEFDDRRVVRAIAWSADGARIATAGDGPIVHVLEVGDPGGPPRELRGGVGNVEAIAWRPDGAELAVAGHDGRLRIFEVEGDGRPARVLEADAALRDLAWSADGARIAAVDDVGLVWVWELGDALRCRVRLELGDDRPVAIVWSTTSDRLIVGDAGGRLHHFDLAALGAWASPDEVADRVHRMTGWRSQGLEARAATSRVVTVEGGS